MAEKLDGIVAAYFKRYDRIYDPSANAEALEAKNAVVARRARLATVLSHPERDNGRSA